MIEKGKIWKFSGVILLIYVFIAGLLVPLKPGIGSVNPSSINAGEETEITVTGYNSHFKSGSSSMRAWLKWDNGKALPVKKFIVKDERNVKLIFSLPNVLPENSKIQTVTLLLDNQLDGASVLPSAIFINSTDNKGVTEDVTWEVPNQFSEGIGFSFPYRNILSETIRNTYFHVPLWFGMMFLFLFAVIHSIKFLRNGDWKSDLKAEAFTKTGIFFGILGLITGALWAKNTWGSYWSWDIKQNMTVVALLIYTAYFILRSSFEDPEKRGRVSAAYGVFAFTTLIPLLYVIPRLTDSLHPGSGGNPAFGSQDLDNTMRMIFYPAIIGWTLLGFWMGSLQYRYLKFLKLRKIKIK